MEKESDKIRILLQKKAELERLLETKQIQADILSKMLDIASEELGVDLRKTIGPKVRRMQKKKRL